LITLLTDFGLKDPYVGVMKGVILSINPDVHIIDISHDVEPQDITEGCFLIKEYIPFFRRGSVHLCIIDPTVGSDRRPIVVSHEGHLFVGPDNGIFSPVIGKQSSVYHVENIAYMLKQVSHTFHGRDVFAPVAAHLSLGLNPQALGKKIDDPVLLPDLYARVKGRRLVGMVVRFDRFGNALSNISIDSFTRFVKGRPFCVELRDLRFKKLAGSYFEEPYTCVEGSSGYLEFGLFKGNLRQDQRLNKGDSVAVSLFKPLPTGSRSD
jgi:S-adenosylmethionine hydrolase